MIFNWLWIIKNLTNMVWLQAQVLDDSVHMEIHLHCFIYFNASRNIFLAAIVAVCCFIVVGCVEEKRGLFFFFAEKKLFFAALTQIIP